MTEAVHHFAGYYPDPRDPDEVIEAVGLTEKRRARNLKLSGGQRRRLDVALGIIGRPRVLFLDEPTTGFDPEALRDFWELIDGLKAEGTTILLTTHYLEEAEHLADRVAVISRGRVVACDTPAQLGGRETSTARVGWWRVTSTGRAHHGADRPRCRPRCTLRRRGTGTHCRPSPARGHLPVLLDGDREATAGAADERHASPQPQTVAIPGTWAIGRRRIVIELKQFFRDGNSALWNFAFPMILLVIFGSVFGGQDIGPDITFTQYFVAG